ncbi:MAG: hypothetical protein AB7F59_09330 [Bdellovibrionales bacterium]
MEQNAIHDQGHSSGARLKAVDSHVFDAAGEYLHTAQEALTNVYGTSVNYAKKHPVRIAVSVAAACAAVGIAVGMMSRRK